MDAKIRSIILSGLVVFACLLTMDGCSSSKLTSHVPPGAMEMKEAPGLGEIPTVREKSSSTTSEALYEKCRSILSPEWNSAGKISQMITAIENTTYDGLNPEDYHLGEIKGLEGRIISSPEADPGDVHRLESLLSGAFSALASDLSGGRTDPVSVYPEWSVSWKTDKRDLVGITDSILLKGNINSVLQNLAPKNPEYLDLKAALAEYRKIDTAGGWEEFTTTLPKLARGLRHPDVAILRKRLAVTEGPISFDPGDEELYDENLEKHLMHFQEMNGLEPDGVAGKATIAALNIPVEARIRTIEANLERWRWLNNSLPGRCIMVNIASYRLTLIDSDSAVLQSLAIVGRSVKQTPVFSSVLKYIVINPSWSIPDPILEDEILPEIIKDSSYLEKNDMVVVRDDGTEIAPSSIDWKNISPGGFPYKVKQEPGPKNPLGQIKFIFPNSFNVYIHDTPSRSLFSKSRRAFSHGCIRINMAHELAAYLLRNDPEWNSGNLQKAIDDGKEKTIVLRDPVPVYILYFTAWADKAGQVYFPADIYERDRTLISALENLPRQKDQPQPAALSRGQSAE